MQRATTYVRSEEFSDSREAGLARNEGIVVTAMHCVNSIPYVCAAESGVRSYLDLPMVCGRAAPELQKKKQ